MLLLLTVLIAIFNLVCAKDTRSEHHTTYSPSIGGPHGKFFDDSIYIGHHHKRISYVRIGGACAGRVCRVFSLKLDYRDNRDDQSTIDTVTHGNDDAARLKVEMVLDKDEYVLVLELSTFKHRVGKIWQRTAWTRIGWMRMTTNRLNQIEFGSHEYGDKYSTLTEGALLYFTGRSGDMIDSLTAHWIETEHF